MSNNAVKGGCGRLGIKAEPVEEFVVNSLLNTLSERRVNPRREAMDARLRKQLDEDRCALDRLAIRRYVQRDITHREHEAARGALLARIEVAELQYAAIKREAENRIIDQQRWATLNLGDQRDILRENVERLIVHPALRGRSRVDLERIELSFRRVS